MSEIFPIVPAPAKAFWLLGIIGLLLAAILILFGYISWSARNVKFHVETTGLRVSGDIYGRTVAFEDMRLDDARRLDSHRDGGYRVKWRTNGIGLPGYASGWFKLRNGEKALAFITDSSRLVYIPTHSGYALMISPQEPDAFLASLKRRAGA